MERSTALEDLLPGTGAKDLTPERPQQPQASGTNIPPDEDLEAACPQPPPPHLVRPSMDLLEFAHQPGISPGEAW